MSGDCVSCCKVSIFYWILIFVFNKNSIVLVFILCFVNYFWFRQTSTTSSTRNKTRCDSVFWPYSVLGIHFYTLCENASHLPACCGECCLGEFMSGGSSLKDTDFSNDTDLSGINVDQHISARYICVKRKKHTKKRTMHSVRMDLDNVYAWYKGWTSAGF